MTVSSLLSVFGAGFLASLSPCVYPIIPISIGYLGQFAKNSGNKYQGLVLFIVGHTIVLIGLGILAASLGESFGFASQDPRVKIFSGIMLVIFGLFSLLKKMPKFVESLNRKTQSPTFGKLGSLFGPLAIGGSAALLTSPCSTPILASVLTLLAGQGSKIHGVIMMSIYSFGFLTIFSILAFGLMTGAKFPRAGLWMNKVHTATSLLIILTGTYFVMTAVFDISI